jgi:xylan 1,4-beta-xylosidase
MKKILILVFLVPVLATYGQVTNEKTFCNPVNLNYRYQGGTKTAYREAADPTVRSYKGKYFMYVSHSGGYWYSSDLLNWNFIAIKSLPIEDYAPDVITVSDTTYFIASSFAPRPIWYTTDPFTDNWKVLGKNLPFAVWDPHFFVDTDGKRFLYWGCSNQDSQPIRAVQLNNKMEPVTEPAVLITHNPKLYGWEIPGEKNEPERNGYNEGPWLTKHNNRYYLQYASPGTEFKTYADGVYTSDSPAGPFKYETYSPFSYKIGGFADGAGHSSTFEDKYGNYWHISTLSISVRHMFERRLSLFPAAFDKDGVLRTFTDFGDYPVRVPDHKIDFEKETLFTGWMLLSYHKKVSVSSAEDKYPSVNASDEDIRTWWSAKSGDPGEYLIMDLGSRMTVNAIQLNFADNESKMKPDDRTNYYCYKVFVSDDQKSWKLLVDRSNNQRDACHDYIELPKAVKTKFIKVENVKVPDGKFSVYDLRVFGKGNGKLPGEVSDFKVDRDANDQRRATVSWKTDPSATGYIVRYGTDKNKLYTSVMVYGSSDLRLTGLNKGVTYYFTVDSFNETGITPGIKTLRAE